MSEIASINKNLWVDRMGPRRYTARNSRGASVAVGPSDAPGEFSPGELLQVALMACAGMSADQRLAIALGDGFDLRIHISARKHDTEERFTDFKEFFEIDLSGLSDEDRHKAVLTSQRAIDRSCTVRNTLLNSAQVPVVAYLPSEVEASGSGAATAQHL